MVFEEWFVDNLPLMRLSDSLESAIKTKFNPYQDTVGIEQFEFSEIAQMLSINETAIRVALSRARKTVREQLIKHKFIKEITTEQSKLLINN